MQQKNKAQKLLGFLGSLVLQIVVSVSNGKKNRSKRTAAYNPTYKLRVVGAAIQAYAGGNVAWR